MFQARSTVLSRVGLLDTCGTQFENPCSARNVLYLLWHHSSEFQEKKKNSKPGTLSPYPDLKLRGPWQASILVSRSAFICKTVYDFEGNAEEHVKCVPIHSYAYTIFHRLQKCYNYVISHARRNERKNMKYLVKQTCWSANYDVTYQRYV